MMNWNPNNKRFLYFHFTTEDGRNEYLKVDTIEYSVFKVTLDSGHRSGRPYMQGFYQLRWMTFLSNYLHFGDGIKEKELAKKFKDGFTRKTRLKYTTERQYIDALKKIIIKFTNT